MIRKLQEMLGKGQRFAVSRNHELHFLNSAFTPLKTNRNI